MYYMMCISQMQSTRMFLMYQSLYVDLPLHLSLPIILHAMHQNTRKVHVLHRINCMYMYMYLSLFIYHIHYMYVFGQDEWSPIDCIIISLSFTCILTIMQFIKSLLYQNHILNGIYPVYTITHMQHILTCLNIIF